MDKILTFPKDLVPVPNVKCKSSDNKADHLSIDFVSKPMQSKFKVRYMGFSSIKLVVCKFILFRFCFRNKKN